MEHNMNSFWKGIFLSNFYSEKSLNLLSEEYVKYIPKENKVKEIDFHRNKVVPFTQELSALVYPV